MYRTTKTCTVRSYTLYSFFFPYMHVHDYNDCTKTEDIYREQIKLQRYSTLHKIQKWLPHLEDRFESKLHHLSLFLASEGSVKGQFSSCGRRPMGVTHPWHPASDDTLQLWGQTTLELLRTRPQGLVTTLPHSVVIVLWGGSGRKWKQEVIHVSVLCRKKIEIMSVWPDDIIWWYSDNIDQWN